MVQAQWVLEGSELHTKFLDALRLQAQLLDEDNTAPPREEKEPSPDTHGPVPPEEVIGVFDAAFGQWIEQMRQSGYAIAQIGEIQQHFRDNIIAMLEMLELLLKSKDTDKISPEGETSRGWSTRLSGNDTQDISRLRTLRLVYDLTNEMVEDALQEAAVGDEDEGFMGKLT